jgi:hypothetical protein
MARKKKETEVQDTPDTPPAEGAAAVLPAPSENGTPEPPREQAPARNRPAASFAAYSDRTTRVEVAVWARQVKVSEQEEYTQYTLTLARAWQKDGIWHGNAAFRIHDLPVLLYLLQQAYNWCLAQRTTVRLGDEPLPF